MSLSTLFSMKNSSYWRKLLIGLSFTTICCLIVAVFLTALNFGPNGEASGFVKNFIYSELCGLLCCFFMLTIREIIRPRSWWLHIIPDILSLITGLVMGMFLGSVLLGIEVSIFVEQFDFSLKILFGGLFVGFTIHYLFTINIRISEVEDEAQKERIKRLSSEKGMAEANLKLLQAQIEPHFLFNTLSNIMTLLDTDLEKGKTMLNDLALYLRTSLSKTRQGMATLGQEMALINHYLKIYQVRMGDRLRFEINMPDDIENFPLQPMLIQPLVENAVRHGLEPEIKGGEIKISGARNKNSLKITVEDTGAGFYEKGAPGLGIENIRQRLKTLYGDKGRLFFEENKPAGVRAVIEVPYEPD